MNPQAHNPVKDRPQNLSAYFAQVFVKNYAIDALEQSLFWRSLQQQAHEHDAERYCPELAQLMQLIDGKHPLVLSAPNRELNVGTSLPSLSEKRLVPLFYELFQYAIQRLTERKADITHTAWMEEVQCLCCLLPFHQWQIPFPQIDLRFYRRLFLVDRFFSLFTAQNSPHEQELHQLQSLIQNEIKIEGKKLRA